MVVVQYDDDEMVLFSEEKKTKVRDMRDDRGIIARSGLLYLFVQLIPFSRNGLVYAAVSCRFS